MIFQMFYNWLTRNRKAKEICGHDWVNMGYTYSMLREMFGDVDGMRVLWRCRKCNKKEKRPTEGSSSNYIRYQCVAKYCCYLVFSFFSCRSLVQNTVVLIEGAALYERVATERVPNAIPVPAAVVLKFETFEAEKSQTFAVANAS